MTAFPTVAYSCLQLKYHNCREASYSCAYSYTHPLWGCINCRTVGKAILIWEFPTVESYSCYAGNQVQD